MVNAFIIGTEPEFVAHSVVLVLRRDEYLLGYATEAYSLLANLLSGTNLQLDLITVVLDTTRYDLRPTLAGINGGIHREVALTAQDFRGGGTGTLLRAVVAKTLNDRIVLER
jgi:hypothetical protein